MGASHGRAGPLLGAILGLVFASLIRPVDAAPGGDVVIVVDQSGSMWGHPEYAHAANDPAAFRLAVAELAMHLVAARVRGTSDVFNLSVVEFATQARVAVPPTEFRYDPGAPHALEQLVASAFARLGDLNALGDQKKINDFLTDTPTALALARVQMKTMMQADPSAGRRHLIVLITDGRPYKSGAVPAALFHDASTQVSNALSEGVDQIRVLGINDVSGADTGYWRAGDGRQWEAAVGPGHAELIDPIGDKLPKRVTSILDEMLGTQSSAALGQQFVLGPYESRLAVMVTLERAITVLPVLVLPDGSTRAPQAPGVGSSQSRARSLAFDVPNPRAGQYSVQFGRNAANTLVTGQVVRSVTHARASLTSTGTLFAGRSTDLQFRAVGAADSDLIVFSPQWPVLSATARVAPGTGSATGPAETVPLTWDNAGTLHGTWKPGQSGAFTIVVEGTYRAQDGSAQSLFAPEAAPMVITVSAQPPFDLVPVQTATKPFTILPFGRRFVDVSFQLRDGAGGGQAKLAAVLKSPDRFAVAHLLDSSGRPVPGEAPIALHAQGGELRASVPVAFNWLSGEGWMPGRRTRTLLLGITADASAVAPGHTYGGVEIPPESGLTRVRAPDPGNTVGGFVVTASTWFLPVMVGAGLLLLASVAVLLGRHMLLIRLQDGRRHRAVKLVILQNTSGAFVGPGAKTFDLTSRRRVNLDRQVQLRTNTDNILLDRLRVRRLPGNESYARAEMRVRARGAKREHVLQLRSGDGRPPVPIPGVDDGWSVALLLEPLRQQR